MSDVKETITKSVEPTFVLTPPVEDSTTPTKVKEDNKKIDINEDAVTASVPADLADSDSEDDNLYDKPLFADRSAVHAETANTGVK